MLILSNYIQKLLIVSKSIISYHNITISTVPHDNLGVILFRNVHSHKYTFHLEFVTSITCVYNYFYFT